MLMKAVSALQKKAANAKQMKNRLNTARKRHP